MESERKWNLGFGPVMLKPGETQLLDLQPKCRFRVEKITAGVYDDGTNNSIHLLALHVGNQEILKLDGDSIEISGKELEIKSAPWSEPALPIVIEVPNRSKIERRVFANLLGTARL